MVPVQPLGNGGGLETESTCMTDDSINYALHNETPVKTLDTKLNSASLASNTLSILLHTDTWEGDTSRIYKKRTLEAFSLGSSETLT